MHTKMRMRETPVATSKSNPFLQHASCMHWMRVVISASDYFLGKEEICCDGMNERAFKAAQNEEQSTFCIHDDEHGVDVPPGDLAAGWHDLLQQPLILLQACKPSACIQFLLSAPSPWFIELLGEVHSFLILFLVLSLQLHEIPPPEPVRS
jgi:hypothetical protein